MNPGISRIYVHRIILIMALLIGFVPLEAQRQLARPYIILHGYAGGMFIAFDHVLSLVEGFDRGLFAGCEVDFKDDGFYYDPSLGPNWWQYFCEPIKLGNPNERIIKTSMVLGVIGCRYTEYYFTRKACADLIKKHIFIKPLIEEKIDTFAANQFRNDYVIGIHYRGTDKHTEAPRVIYEDVLKAVQEKLDALKNNEFRIFIATDEWAFVDYMTSIFPDRVCYYQEAPRSIDGQPVHMNPAYSGYEKGESALIDCLLLSKCDFLIRCSSNLSRWSTYFNPSLPVVELNQRHKSCN